ncbi:MAG TPA: hypothetical protein VF077_06225 [Nitrospiraceae bacterium]
MQSIRADLFVKDEKGEPDLEREAALVKSEGGVSGAMAVLTSDWYESVNLRCHSDDELKALRIGDVVYTLNPSTDTAYRGVVQHIDRKSISEVRLFGSGMTQRHRRVYRHGPVLEWRFQVKLTRSSVVNTECLPYEIYRRLGDFAQWKTD